MSTPRPCVCLRRSKEDLKTEGATRSVNADASDSFADTSFADTSFAELRVEIEEVTRGLKDGLYSMSFSDNIVSEDNAGVLASGRRLNGKFVPQQVEC